MSPLARGLLASMAVVLTAGACGDGASPSDPVEELLDDTPSSTTASEIDDDVAGDSGDEPPTTVGPEADAGDLVFDQRWPSDPAGLDPATPARWRVEVIATAPHDPAAFTQGLERLDDGRLIESTGRRGISDVRIVDPATGEIELAAALEPEEFGEGLTVVDDIVVQLTWQEEVARRWALPELSPLPSFTYEGEGWGLCLADDRLAMTDGTDTLEWRDPSTFAVLSSVTVRLGENPVSELNELECVDGVVLANVWRSSFVMVIRPDGAVVATIDATELVDTIASETPTTDVLNGIAAEPDGTFSMTGKLWPTRFIVRLVEA